MEKLRNFSHNISLASSPKIKTSSLNSKTDEAVETEEVKFNAKQISNENISKQPLRRT